jgi:hypothetical protein
MMGFVLGDAHTEAIRAVGEISRGGSITDHWEVGDVADVTWQDVPPLLADHSGPVY